MAADFHAALSALRPNLLRIAHLHLRNEGWAEDAVSETLLAALEGQHAFAGQSQLKTWVVGILKHKIVDQFRRGLREVSIEARMEATAAENLDEAFLADGHFAQWPSAVGDSPEGALEQAQFFEVVQQGLEQMPPALARIFTLRESLDMDTEEICKELGITTTNAFVMLYRARMRLRAHLEQHWFAPRATSKDSAHGTDLQTGTPARRPLDGSRPRSRRARASAPALA
jgi:RNA polymerase sigma-70 factor (ECF subfamily)